MNPLLRACAALLLLASGLPAAHARTLEEIRNTLTLRICVAGSSAAFYQANAEAFAAYLGVNAEVRHLKSFDEQFQNADGKTVLDQAYIPRLLEDGSCDLFPNDLHILPWRESKMRLVPYYTARKVVIARRSLHGELKQPADLAGRKAVVQKGTAYETWLLDQNKGPYAARPVQISYADTAAAMRLVAGGKADFTVAGTEGAFMWVRTALDNLDIMFPVDDPVKVGWGMQPEAKVLARELGKFFADEKRVGTQMDRNWHRQYGISLMEYQLYDATFGSDGIDLELILRWVLPLGSGLLIIVGVVLFANRRLAGEVRTRLAAEAALRTAGDQQAAIFESASAGIALIRNSQIVSCNQRLEQMLGFGKGEVTGLTSQRFFNLSDEEAEEKIRAKREQLARGETYRREHLLTRRDGSTFWGRFGGHAIDIADPDKGSVWTLDDISDEHAAAEALRTAHAEQAAIFDSATSGIALIRNSRIEHCNQRLEEMLGYGKGEMLGLSSQRFFNLSDAQAEERILSGRQQLASGETYRRERLLARKDGRTFWCRFSGHALDAADLSKGSVWMLDDITEEHAAAEALQEAKRLAESATQAKSMFLASMSHEIRTPMNGVLGMLQLLGFTPLDADQRSTLEGARESAQSLLRIIDDLLDFSKIEAGRLEISAEPTSIAALVRSVQQVYSGVAAAKDLPLKASVDPHISPALNVDGLRLRQILNNFVSNALKFTQRGEVAIAVKLLEHARGFERLRFSVSDTGTGVSADAQAQLFQPYVQAAIDTARRYGGTGLGLTICRRLADMMGGSIEMQSELGKGTTMMLTLILPVADPAELPKAENETEAQVQRRSRTPAPGMEQARAEGRLVLVAEDNATNRSVITRLLKQLGYAATAAVNGQEALKEWEGGGIALLITDCDMPEMDGYQLTQAIRERESQGGGSRLTIIACTANAMAEEVQRCLAAGMDDFLAKPVEFGKLAAAMDKWLPHPGAGDGAAAAAPAAAQPSTPTRAAEEIPIDRTALEMISGGDASAELDILAEFRQSAGADMQLLRDALAGRNIATVIRASHSLKGASLTVGAARLATVTARMEKAGRQNDWQGVASEQDELEQEFQRLNAWLAASH